MKSILVCVDCQKTFPSTLRGSGSHRRRCPACWLERRRSLQRVHGRLKAKRFPDRRRSEKLKQRYGITLADFHDMLEAQGDACAVCHRAFNDRKRCTDHDHTTKRVRGIVCSSCNTRLSWFESRRAHILDYLAGPNEQLVYYG